MFIRILFHIVITLTKYVTPKTLLYTKCSFAFELLIVNAVSYEEQIPNGFRMLVHSKVTAATPGTFSRMTRSTATFMLAGPLNASITSSSSTSTR